MTVINKALLSAQSEDWETPEDLFAELQRLFNFTLDPCATDKNAKCDQHYTKTENGLDQEWSGNVYVNPPYGRQIHRWLEKAVQSIDDGSCGVIVFLLPARTDTRWFHRFFWDTEHQRAKPGIELWFLKGRLRFSNAQASAPFPSLVAILTPKANEPNHGS